MPRRGRVVVVGAGLVAAVAVAASSVGAQAPGARTITLYEPPEGGNFRIVDNAPRSPVKNPESRKYRFSVGDELVFSSPLFDKKGGTKVGTVYVKATVVSGKTFPTLKALAHGTFVFDDGSQINAAGVFAFAQDVRIGLAGGTGAYVGARGDIVSKSNEDGSSVDTITVLP